MLHALRKALITSSVLAAALFSFAPNSAQAAQLVQGSKDAKVQILMYGDLQCPFCARFWTNMDRFKVEYGDKIGISFAHFPLAFHAQAMPAAINAECAGQQGKFVEFIDGIYKDQTDMGQEHYLGLAQHIGVQDMPAFAKCVNDPKTKKVVEADLLTGEAIGVNGTPYIYINGNLIQGALPYAEFKKEIDAALNR